MAGAYSLVSGAIFLVSCDQCLESGNRKFGYPLIQSRLFLVRASVDSEAATMYKLKV